MADLVLFCIVRYVLMKESYFYNTVCGIFLMLVIAIFSLDKKLERRKWHKGLSVAWFGMCIMFTISDFLVSKKACGLGDHTGICVAGSDFLCGRITAGKICCWKSFEGCR